MGQFFRFEEDFVDSLRCVPMQVRLKLDTCGVKLKLSQWSKFNQTDRQTLVASPCETDSEIAAYRTSLHHLILERTGDAATDLVIETNPPWNDTSTIPESVQKQAQLLNVTLSQTQWASLTSLQRFALIKLSRSHHENQNFLPAMREFQIV